MEELVPAGFRFYPTEEELICFYLHHKLEGSRPNLDQVIPVVDIYTHEPWDLPMVAGERGSWRGENEEQWFFFTAQQEREARGGKPNRTTASGYWKATGSPGYVFSTTHKRAVGVKKTMVFYKGRAPLGKKTPWKMNEYKAIDFGSPQINLDASSSHHAPPIPKLRHEMSVCRVYITSGSSRAFDRRPSAASTTALPPPHHHLQLAADAATDDHHHHQLTPTTTATTATNAVVVEKSSSSSTDSSKSRGGDQKADQQEISNTTTNTHNIMDHEMITSGLQPLWEWEQLNWP